MRTDLVGRVRVRVVVGLVAFLLAGCSDDPPPPPCVATPAISGDLGVRWSRTLGFTVESAMRLRSDGSLVIAGQLPDAPKPADGSLGEGVLALAPDGKVLWTRLFTGFWTLRDLAIDAEDNVYLVGDLGSNDADLGTGRVHGVVMLAKLAPDGRTAYATLLDRSLDLGGGAPLHAESLRVAVNGTQVVVAGEVTDVRTGDMAGFVAQCDPASGDVLNRRRLGAGVAPRQLASDDRGGFIVAGALGTEGQSTLDWGGPPLIGDHDSFALYLDGSGTVTWARALGAYTRVTALVIDGNRAFLGGTFAGTLKVDGPTVSARGWADLMILAIDDFTAQAPTLTPWAVVPAGSSDGLALAPDGYGGVVAVANAFEALAVEDVVLSPTSLAVLHLDGTGRLVAHAAFGAAGLGAPAGSGGVLQVGGAAFFATTPMVLRDPAGVTYALGHFSASIDFDGAKPLTLGWYGDGMYLAALGPASVSTTAVGCPVPRDALAASQTAPAPKTLALAGDSVLMANDTELAVLPVGGGASRSLAVAQKHINGLLIHDQQVIWINAGTRPPQGPGSDGSVVVAPMAGGPAIVLADGQDSPRAVDTDGETVYWTAGGEISTGTSVRFTGSLLSAPLAGGPTKVLASGFEWVGPVVAGDGFVVFAGDDRPSRGRIMRVGRDGQGRVELAVTDAPVTAMVIDGDTVYWSEAQPALGFTSIEGAVRAVSLSGGEVTTIAHGLNSPRLLTLTGGQIYWSDSLPDTTSIWRAPLSGGTAVNVRPPASYGAVALDQDRLAWISTKNLPSWSLHMDPLGK